VAQVPFCDGLRNLSSLGLGLVARLTLAGLRDLLSSLTGGAPYRIPAVGVPGALAAMTTPDAVSGFQGMNPPGSTWRNEVCARIVLELGLYRPGVSAGDIRCPILYCIGEQDLLTPASLAEAAAQRAPRAEVKRYNCGHFDVYVGKMFERVLADQIEFFVRHLQVESRPQAVC
jgi:fermentation-respiration switch protein FrsA (DUF1100 family)